jgi:hypothetical protein
MTLMSWGHVAWVALSIVLMGAPSCRWLVDGLMVSGTRRMTTAQNRESGVCFGIGLALFVYVVSHA